MIEAAFFAVLLAVPEMDCAKYWERAYGRWRPSELAKTDRGIRLRLNEQTEPRRIADLFFDGRSWRQVIPADAEAARQRQFARERAREAHCQTTVPYRQPDQQTAIALRPHLRVGNSVEERPAACEERDGVIWFGLGFYEGEGSDGVGGIGRYIAATKQIEVRRPEWLRDKSVDHIAFDGHDLWLAVSQHYEKDEQPWGLVRYDWEHNELRPLAASDEAPCGFTVVDLLLESEHLWVATDLALSLLDRSAHTWTHWIPARDGTLRPGSCRPMYERAMNVASELWNCEAAFDTADWVARFAPEVARATILREPALRPFESSAAGTVAKNPHELRRMVGNANSAVAPRAMLAFAQRKSGDPEWREFAFSYAKRTGDLQPLRYFRDDDAIFEYLLSVARSNDQHRVHKAIGMLPWIGGRRAVRPLLSIVDAALDSNDRYKAIIGLEALERAAHLRIEADGRATALAANSDTPEYSDEEFNAFVRFRAEIDELQKIVAQWHRRLAI